VRVHKDSVIQAQPAISALCKVKVVHNSGVVVSDQLNASSSLSYLCGEVLRVNDVSSLTESASLIHPHPHQQQQQQQQQQCSHGKAQQFFTCKPSVSKPTHSGKSPTHSRHFAQIG